MNGNNQYATIVFHIDDEAHSGRVTTETFDIKDLKELLNDVDSIVTSQCRDSRPTISYSVESGSVKNIFKTTRQVAIQLSAVFSMIVAQNSLEGLESRMATSLENIQTNAKKKGYVFQIYSSENPDSILTISPRTNYHVSQDIWIDAEVYLYGTLMDAGGKNTPNIHLTTDNGKNYTISATKDQLRKEKENLLYKYFGVRAKAKQRIDTGEIKEDSLELIELLKFNPIFNEEYLNSLIKQATPRWHGVVDADEWVRSIRGYE